MKNIFIVTTLLLVLLITGCSNNQVICIVESDHDEIGFIAKTEVIGFVKDGNVTKYEYKTTMTFEDEDLATSSYNTLVNGYEDKDVVFKQKNKVITGTSMVKINEKVTKLEFVEELEKEGYTCK